MNNTIKKDVLGRTIEARLTWQGKDLLVTGRIPFRSIMVAFPPFCQSKDANMRTSISSLARTISAMSCFDTPSK